MKIWPHARTFPTQVAYTQGIFHTQNREHGGNLDMPIPKNMAQS